MKRFCSVILIAFTLINVHAEDSLECMTVEETNKIIRCTFHSTRVNFDRNITFTWHSLQTPQDDRQRTIEMKANHGSLYDFRYYYGRAPGEWIISAKDDEENVLAETRLQIGNQP